MEGRSATNAEDEASVLSSSAGATSGMLATRSLRKSNCFSDWIVCFLQETVFVSSVNFFLVGVINTCEQNLEFWHALLWWSHWPSH
jgi:hypothetical protein